MSHSFDEVDRNYDAFVARLPDILSEHRGEYALLHDANIVTYFADGVAAMIEGARTYGEGRYSVQEVTNECDSLGFYSYAGGSGKA